MIERMELSTPAMLTASFLLVLLGFLVGCAYYSWERHYKFKRRGSADYEVGMRFSVDTPPTFFGLREVNDLLQKGQRVTAVKEGAVLARKTGEDSENVEMHISGFTLKVQFANS
jgi:hypothetical protein